MGGLGIDWWTACKNGAATAAVAGCLCVCESKTETLRENMGQCKSKERDFKEQKRRKTLEVRF
jgi:hypothetical protein